MKKVFIIFIVVFLLFSPFFEARGDVLEEREEELTIHFFDDRLCPVCRDAKSFVEELAEKEENVNLEIYPISDNIEKIRKMAEKKGIEDYSLMAPTIFIGDNLFQFSYFTSRHEEMIERAVEGEIVEEDCCIINIPFFNIEIDISGWSLPFITVILGSLDGFNVCSIGALILILSIVLVFDSKKKIFFYGGLFILTAVAIYGVLVFAWGRLFEMIVAQIGFVRIIVGLAALGGGIYFFKEFWRFFRYGPTCKSSENALTKKATNRLKEAFNQPGKGVLYLVPSVMFFALVITIVELPCSVGIPIAFTGILAEANLTLFSFTLFVLFYLFFYMLIELIIFTGAVLTKKIWFAGSGIITWVTFVGALVLFYLAFYYLFY